MTRAEILAIATPVSGGKILLASDTGTFFAIPDGGTGEDAVALVTSNPRDYTGTTIIENLIGINQAGYNAIPSPDPRTEYAITDAVNTEPWIFVLSGPESTTAATIGQKSWFRVVRAMTLSAANVSVDALTPPTGGPFIADITKNGVSIYSVLPEITATEYSSTTGVLGSLLVNPTTFAIGDIVGIWVDAIGTTGAGFSMTANVTLP